MILAPVNDVRSKLEKKMLSELDRCVADTRKEWNYNFFVIIQYLPKKKEGKLHMNIIPLPAIPTPTFDTTLFEYDYAGDKLDLIWTLPPQQIAEQMYVNRTRLDPKEYPLLEYVIKYFEGTFFHMIDNWEQNDGNEREREHATRDYTERPFSTNGCIDIVNEYLFPTTGNARC